MIIAIIVIIVLLLVLLFFISCFIGKSTLKKYTTKDSCIVFGSKGSGKSVIFQQIANFNKYGYVSNTDFGNVCYLIQPKEVSVFPNTWNDVISGDIKPIVKNIHFEKRPVLLDDASVYFPNFAEDKLKKHYESMPIAFALWRHIYDAPIHINTQDVNRTWKLLREQQSYFIYAKGVIKIFGFLFVRYRFYDNINSASMKLKPFKSSLLNKYSKGEKDTFIANNGTIKDYHFIIRCRDIHYDSRYFHKVLFNEKAPNKRNSLKILKDTYKLQRKLERMEKSQSEGAKGV